VSREKIGAILKQLAIKQLGQPHDVSHVLEFLIRPESHCITGQVIYLGGAG
jgi:3-oxoacyl-[acyl-carrier protein] reductase